MTSCTAGGKVATFSPASAASSAIITPTPPETVSKPTRVLAGRPRNGEAVGDIEELLDRACAPSAMLTKQRLVDRVVAGQGGGVRSGCHGAERGSADFDDHHGLARGTRQFKRLTELVAVPTSLQASHDDLRGRIARHPGDAIGDTDVRLVAGGYPRGEADAALARHGVGIGPERAALADDADLAGLGQPGRHHGRERRIDRAGDVHETKAVRSQHADAGRARLGSKPALRRLALLAHFGEAGGEHDDVLHARRDGVVERGRGAGGRDGKYGQIDRPAHRLQRGKGAAALDRIGLAVDRIDLAGITLVDQIAHRHGADLARNGRRADDGDGTRRQKGIEVWQGHGRLGESAGDARAEFRRHPQRADIRGLAA